MLPRSDSCSCSCGHCAHAAVMIVVARPADKLICFGYTAHCKDVLWVVMQCVAPFLHQTHLHQQSIESTQADSATDAVSTYRLLQLMACTKLTIWQPGAPCFRACPLAILRGQHTQVTERA